MFRQIISRAIRAPPLKTSRGPQATAIRAISSDHLGSCEEDLQSSQPLGCCFRNRLVKSSLLANENIALLTKPAIGGYSVNTVSNGLNLQQCRLFHAHDSKSKYLDFRYKLKTNHLRLHLLLIRRAKMKKHRRRKFRRKFKSFLAKQRLKREIAKEKTFRVELLTIIRRAEMFDPKEFALKKIAEVNNQPVPLSKEERLEALKELIRKNRYQVDYVKPKHRRAEYELELK